MGSLSNKIGLCVLDWQKAAPFHSIAMRMMHQSWNTTGEVSAAGLCSNSVKGLRACACVECGTNRIRSEVHLASKVFLEEEVSRTKLLFSAPSALRTDGAEKIVNFLSPQFYFAQKPQPCRHLQVNIAKSDTIFLGGILPHYREICPPKRGTPQIESYQCHMVPADDRYFLPKNNFYM